MAEKKSMGMDEIEEVLSSKVKHWSNEVRSVISDLVLEISARDVKIATLRAEKTSELAILKTEKDAEIATISNDNQRLIEEKKELLKMVCDRWIIDNDGGMTCGVRMRNVELESRHKDFLNAVRVLVDKKDVANL